MRGEKTLFIDETGKQSFKHASPYFILSGCAITTEHLEEIRNLANNIIFKYWGSNRSYLRKYKEKQIVFHAKDIFNCKGPFVILKDPDITRNFWDDVYGQLMSRPDITYFITIVDKSLIHSMLPNLNGDDILDKSYEKLLRSFIEYLIKTKSTGRICAESCADQDKALVSKLSYFQRNSYMIFKNAKLVNEKITSLSLVNKNDNNIGSQIADLMAWTGANRYLVDKKIKKIEDLRYEERRILRMYNTRLKSNHSRYKQNKFIVINK